MQRACARETAPEFYSESRADYFSPSKRKKGSQDCTVLRNGQRSCLTSGMVTGFQTNLWIIDIIKVKPGRGENGVKLAGENDI